MKNKNKLLVVLLFTIFLTSQIIALVSPNETNKTFLLENYGKNKELHEQYELSILVALSKYPELSNISIVFKEKSLSTTMSAQPKLNFIFLSKEKHKYKITINNKKQKEEGFSYKISLLIPK